MTGSVGRRGFLGAAGISAAMMGAAAFSRPAHAAPSDESTGSENAGSGVFNVREFGALGDGVADDTMALQQALDAAYAVGGAVYLPLGSYAISSPLILRVAGAGVGPRIFGDVFLHGTPERGSTIMPHASVTAEDPLEAIFLGEPGRARRQIQLDHLSLFGDGRVSCGIYDEALINSTLFRIDVHRMAKDGMAFGYGYYNRVDNCRFFNNDGNGISTVAPAINTFSVTNTMFLRNGEAGFRMNHSGASVRFDGCSFEGHGVAGLVFRTGAAAVQIANCYFESNVEDGDPGYSFTNPERNLRAEIVINGTETEGAIGSDTACGAVVITGNSIFQARNGNTDDFVAAYGTHTRLEISNNTFRRHPSLTDQKINVLRTGTSKTGLGASVENPVLAGNDAITNLRDELTVTPLKIDDLGGQTLLHQTSIEGVARTNYAPTLADFVPIDAGAPGALRPTAKPYRQSEARVLSTTRAGDSHAYGFELDLADYPELAGKYVYFACYAKVSGTDAGAAVWTSQLGNSTSEHVASTDWQVISFVDQLPESGAVAFGVRKIADDSSATLMIARPVLAEVGVPFSDIQ